MNMIIRKTQPIVVELTGYTIYGAFWSRVWESSLIIKIRQSKVIKVLDRQSSQ